MILHEYLPPEVINRDYHLPKAYFRVHELGLLNLDIWRFIQDKDEFHALSTTIGKDYTSSILVPFARRVDNDDIACFVVSHRDYSVNEVVIAHLYSGAEFEESARQKSFWDWFRLAVNEMIEANA